MGIVLSVYSQKAFKEILLPSLNNADYSITLEKRYFQIQEDIMLEMEVLDDKWSIKPNKKYRVYKNKAGYEDHPLKDKDMLIVENCKNKEIVSVLVKDVFSVFHSYDKFYIQNQKRITIGKDAENDIVYDYLKTVSREHAVIEKRKDKFWVVNKSSNGTYVNSTKVATEAMLNFGDYINIMGLHLMYLGDVLAIDMKEKDIVLNHNKLQPYEVGDEGTMYLREATDKEKGKSLYHRAPRNYERLDKEPIEIENPPEHQQYKQPSLFLTIGPSLTMALPMVLGCMMMVYSTTSQGGTSSLYMYSGLIMSVSSALIGVIWALINMNQNKKEEKAKEQHRFNAYSKYLVEKTEAIKEKYESTMKMLEEMYPSTDVCLEYNSDGGILWNRNRTHDDFLTHRLGIGDVPFQVPIQVAKKRFRIYEDELVNKPLFIKEDYEKLYKVPVTVDFTQHSIIGVVGGKDKIGAHQIAKIMSSQVAANNCYTDVKLGYIYTGEKSLEREVWDFAKWMPHVWSEDKKTRFIASNKDEASDVFYELTKIFRARKEEKAERFGDAGIPKPYYIIFISDPSLLEGELFSKYVFDKDVQYGLTTVLLAERYEELPNSCEFIIQNDEHFKGMYDVFDRKDEKIQIQFDSVNEEQLEKFVNHIAGLQVMEMEEGGAIPSSLTFFEMFDVKKVEEIPVKELWMKNRIYENIKGIIGHKAGGTACYLDVHEKYHGPHGLVAGTTGSGKSETLQTYMLSLAVNYSPDDIGFFIIDYKGGGMANLFDGMPHMVGQISNLSGNQVKRAMISIKSENKRRQRVFNENGVNNINAYTKLYKNGETALPVPHLFIIIDEFAELKREEPDFMKELISVAQVGRSLGVHLILATQKPSGTVDDNIWSNSKFRLCLRVQDKQDSNDMLHKPDAAYITRAGRCYLQVGNDEIYELFQSGYSGAVYDANVGNEKTDIARMIRLNGKIEMTGNMAKSNRKNKVQYAWIEKLTVVLAEAVDEVGYDVFECLDDKNKKQRLAYAMYAQMDKYQMEYAVSLYNTQRLMDFIELYCMVVKRGSEDIPTDIIKSARKEMKKLPEAKEKTQLEAVKEHLAQVAKDNGYDHQLQLWMPELGDKIYLDSFDKFRETSFKYGGWKAPAEEWSLDIEVGMMDDPENQNQMPLEVNFATDGHIAVCGNIVSGKSTMMQTMMYALLQKYTAEMINVYGLDFSSKMMAAFEDAPQVGGIMFENDQEKIGKFFNMISEILKERKNLFRGGNYSQYVQVNGITIPAIIIFIDNYSAFKEKTEEAYEEVMIQLSKEGVNYGIFLVVSGNGFGMNDITTRVGENINTTLCLALQDRYAYGDLLHNMQFDVMPEGGIKGRGLAYYEKRILEYQTALAIEAENDYQRMEFIREQCSSMNESWNKKRARRIPEIPKKPTWGLFEELDDFDKAIADRSLLPIGYNEANASVYSIPLNRNYCYLIWGGKRSGKTNLMKVCIQSALKKDCQICVIDSPDKKLGSYAKLDTVTYADSEQTVFEYFKELLPEFKRRNQLKQQLLAQDLDEDEIYARMSEEQPIFIFISDLSWFVPFIYNAEIDMKGFLENIIAKGQLHNIYFISKLSMEKKELVAGYAIYEHFSGFRTGIHLGGKVSENHKLSFDYMSFLEQAKGEKAGIGQIPDAGDEKDVKRVVIPLSRR